MSSFGIGLGGFMDGFQKGFGIRNDIDERKLRNERLKVQDARLAKQDARTDLENEREDVEYDRAIKQRTAVDAVGAETKQQFDSAVAAGKEQPDNFDQFWNQYALPRLKHTYLENGDMENAKKVAEWGETAAAKQGGKLFSSALLKAQTGDSAGALDDVIKAGQIKGYIEHGYELDGQEPLIDPTGKSIGYRLKVKGADGKIVEQDIRTEDLPRMIATFANPEAAWQSHVTAAADAKKSEDELKTYAAKKEIDKAYGLGNVGKGRSTAITALRKRLDGGLDGEGQKFDDLPTDQKEKLIDEELRLQQGTGGEQPAPAPQRKVIVDQATGQVVRPEAVAADKLKAASTQAVAEEAAKPQSREQAVAYAVGNAEERMQLGDDPKLIAQDLLNNGVPQEVWPPELRQALTKSAGVVGIGGR